MSKYAQYFIASLLIKDIRFRIDQIRFNPDLNFTVFLAGILIVAFV